VTLFALIAHKTHQPKHTYLSPEEKRFHKNPLMKRQPASQVENGNVVLNYIVPPSEDFVRLKAEHEVHPDLYRFLVERYTYINDVVVCFPMSTGYCGCAALYDRRKFYGADPDQRNVDEAILRAFKLKTSTTEFGVDGNTEPVDIIPPRAAVTFFCPPQFRNCGKEDFSIEMAKEEALSFGLEIKESLNREAGNGLFTTAAVLKGHALCYYWGEAVFRSPEGVYNVDRYNAAENADRLIVTGERFIFYLPSNDTVSFKARNN